ncbi:MAG: DUF805 domain-containing protein [Litorilinea sp.]
MPIHANVCPSCSAPITVPPQVGQMYCPFCSTPLSIQRDADTINLDIAERITNVVQDSASATQVELRRLQLTQEVSALRSQLAHIRSEIRLFEREPQTAETSLYLAELYAEAQELEDHIGELRGALNIAQPAPGNRPRRPSLTRPTPGASARGATSAPDSVSDAPAKSGWLWLFFSVQGRMSRGQFVVGLVAVLVLMAVAIAVIGPTDAQAAATAQTTDTGTDTATDTAAQTSDDPSVASCVGMPLTLLSFWMGIAVGAKRYHDRNKSAWWVLLGLIPFVNLWVLFELAFLPGTPGPNPYGAPARW